MPCFRIKANTYRHARFNIVEPSRLFSGAFLERREEYRNAFVHIGLQADDFVRVKIGETSYNGVKIHTVKVMCFRAKRSNNFGSFEFIYCQSESDVRQEVKEIKYAAQYAAGCSNFKVESYWHP